VEEDPEGAGVLRGVRLRQVWYKRGNISLISVAGKKKFTMPPRRERKSLDPEDREVRRRGRSIGNP